MTINYSGIEDNLNSGKNDYLKVYPNPFRNELIIEANCQKESETLYFNAYDICGKNIRTGVISGNKEIISTENWSKGMYFIIMNLNNEIIFKEKYIKN